MTRIPEGEPDAYRDVNETFEPEDGLTARLRALGQHPIDPATQSHHLTAMADAAATPRLLATLGNRVRVAVALVVGFALGTTGLASAGALGPLQPIASSTLEKVGVEVPDGKGGVDRETEGCPTGQTFKNRGHYIKAMRELHGADTPAFEEAKKSRCGMPVNSEGTPGADDDAGDANDGEERDASDGRESEELEAEEPKGHGAKPEGAGNGRPASPGKSAEKGTSAEKSQKPADGEVPGSAADAEGECAGGEAAPAATPPEGAPAQPECAATEAESHTPTAPAGETDVSSDAGADAEDTTQDPPAAEQVPSAADPSSGD